MSLRVCRRASVDVLRVLRTASAAAIRAAYRNAELKKPGKVYAVAGSGGGGGKKDRKPGGGGGGKKREMSDREMELVMLGGAEP